MEKLFPITAHECCFFVLCVQFGMNCKYNSINLTSKYKCCFFYVIYLCLMTHWYNYIKVNMEFQIVKKFAEISVDSLSRFKVLWNWRVYKTVIATLYIYLWRSFGLLCHTQKFKCCNLFRFFCVFIVFVIFVPAYTTEKYNLPLIKQREK